MIVNRPSQAPIRVRGEFSWAKVARVGASASAFYAAGRSWSSSVASTSFHHQPEAQHPKLFAYRQAGRPITPVCALKAESFTSTSFGDFLGIIATNVIVLLAVAWVLPTRTAKR